MDIIIFIAIGIVARLVPHVPNMTPVGALAITSGAKLGLKKALIVTLSIMLFTDLLIGLHPVMWATYGSLFLAVILGRVITKKQTLIRIGAATLTSALLFFIITNFAVWIAPLSMYPKTLAGFIECYVMALPFFRNSLMGDVFYTTVFFAGYEMVGVLSRRVFAKIPLRR